MPHGEQNARSTCSARYLTDAEGPETDRIRRIAYTASQPRTGVCDVSLAVPCATRCRHDVHPCAEASRAETFDGLASLPRRRGWPAGPGPAASRSPVRPPLLRGSLHAGRRNPARALEADQLA